MEEGKERRREGEKESDRQGADRGKSTRLGGTAEPLTGRRLNPDWQDERLRGWFGVEGRVERDRSPFPLDFRTEKLSSGYLQNICYLWLSSISCSFSGPAAKTSSADSSFIIRGIICSIHITINDYKTRRVSIGFLRPRKRRKKKRESSTSSPSVAPSSHMVTGFPLLVHHWRLFVHWIWRAHFAISPRTGHG